jgi:four helix bundle protein
VSGVERFEDLIAWQKVRGLTRSVCEITRNGGFARDFGLANQMQRAAVSVMSNIAEGFERRGTAEFEHFLRIAKASCPEVQSLLFVALDVRYINDDMFSRVRTQADEASRVIAGLILAVHRRRQQEQTNVVQR